MKRPFIQASLLYAVFATFFSQLTIAQDTRAFNQNASRSNHTRSFNQNSARSNRGLSIAFGPVYSSPLESGTDSLLFRGTGAGFRFGADYSFGIASLGLVSGFGSSSPDEAAINNFLKRSGIPQDQLVINKAKQQNVYLLLGPSIRFGSVVEISAHAKGGLFINNGGFVNIQQRGANRSVYRNESTEKTVYPGFLTGLNVQYNTSSNAWSFGLGVDYMNTRSQVNNYDIRRGGGVEAMKLTSKISDIVAGITIRYNIKSPRDAQSGMASGRRVLPTVNKREMQPREAGSGMATGRQLGKPKYEDMNLSDVSTDNGSCGPVTMTKTNPDGSTEEMTFSCPDDAANYTERISMNVTTPKQTQGATFGEKVNAGLHAAGSAVSQGARSTGIISGKLTWTTSGTTGIVTNAIISNSSPRSGSATLNSQSSSTRTTNQSSFGTLVRISAREAGSGMATGKRSRDAGSGLATGRRQYEPMFIENGGAICNPCLAEVKMASIKNNPLYQQSGNSGSNPLYESNKRTTGDEDCDGIGGVDVYLLDIETRNVVSKTRTETCGDFFFANVPEGNYIVRVSGSFLSKKGYDVYLASKTDLLGSVEQSNEPVQLFLNTGDDNNGMTQKAGISTSRSNIRTKSISIIEADLDGDGEYESLRATATFSDGSSRDITSSKKASGLVLDGDALQMSRRVEVLKSNRLSSVTINNTGGRFTATGTFSDGNKRDIADDVIINTAHNGVRQYSFTVADTDDDGAADAVVKTKTKSNQSNDRIATGDIDGDCIWSPRSNIKILNVATGDLDGDGVAETLIGGALPGGAVISAARTNGDPVHGVDVKPGIAMKPGSPIGGLSIKGGKNPGGNSRTTQTNENGEFEFPGLEPGSYTFSMEQNIFIEDETPVAVRGEIENINNSQDDGIMARKGWDGTVKGGSKFINSGDEGIAVDMNEAVTFRWTPLVPKPKEPVTYKLRVWQLMQGQNGTQAMRSGKPVVEKTLINSSEVSVSSILTGPCKPPYLCDFIWSVEAMSAAGKLINNNAGSGSFSINDGAVTKAQDHNSSRSNKTASNISVDPNGGDGNSNDTKVQDHNSSRSNKTASNIAADPNGDDGNSNNTKVQDHNSSRSNKSASNIAVDGDGDGETNSGKSGMPVKWSAPEAMQKTINTTRDNIKSMLSSLDELEQQLNADQNNEKSVINTSRSNIKNQRTRINELEQILNNLQQKDKDVAMKELEQKRNETDLQFLKLRESVQQLGSSYTSISNVLKTRHDTVKNSIGNIR